MDEAKLLEQKLGEALAAAERTKQLAGRLPEKEFTGQAPDRTVTATVDGTGKLKDVGIEPHALARSDPRALSKAIVAAVDAANRQATRFRTEKLSNTGEESLREVDQLLAKMMRF